MPHSHWTAWWVWVHQLWPANEEEWLSASLRTPDSNSLREALKLSNWEWDNLHWRRCREEAPMTKSSSVYSNSIWLKLLSLSKMAWIQWKYRNLWAPLRPRRTMERTSSAMVANLRGDDSRPRKGLWACKMWQCSWLTKVEHESSSLWQESLQAAQMREFWVLEKCWRQSTLAK